MISKYGQSKPVRNDNARIMIADMIIEITTVSLIVIKF